MTYTRKKPPRRRKPPPRFKWEIWIPVIVAVAGAISAIVVAYFEFGWPPGRPTPVPTSVTSVPAMPEVKITSHGDGQSVPDSLPSVSGTYARVPEDKQIWLVVSKSSICYPQDGPAKKVRIGNWQHGPVIFYGTGEYELSTVLADENASTLLRDAVGHQEGMRCLPLPEGAELIESITVNVSSPTATPSPSPTITPSPTATPAPQPEVFEGKICQIKSEQDTNTIYLRQAEFNTLGLSAGSAVNAAVLNTGGKALNVTLDVDTGLMDCLVRIPLSLRNPLGVAGDTDLPLEQRPIRLLAITAVPIEVEITSLSERQVVPAVIPSVKGTYSNIPPDCELWMVVFVGASYYPQNGPAVLLPNGTWNHGSAHFGGIDEFIVYAVLIAEEESPLFRTSIEQGQALRELPDRAQILDAVTVVRQQ